MEDAVAVKQKDDLIFLGVFDGHGGSETSETLASTFPSLVLSAYPSTKPYAKRTDYLVAKSKEMDQTLFHFEDGSTAVFGILPLTKNRLDVGNLGDSRLLVVYDGWSFKATEDHKPEDIWEMKRISKAGGFVKCYQVPPKYKSGPPAKMCRVNGNLATSRAFGDFHMGLKSNLPGQDSSTYAVSDVPEVYERCLNNAKFIVLARDGLWALPIVVNKSWWGTFLIQSALIDGKDTSTKSLEDVGGRYFTNCFFLKALRFEFP
jgi:serine/threonine protein phosphatase PrpC